MNAQLCRRLFDARSAARRIDSLTATLHVTDYTANAVLRLAVERLFEILGETLAAVLRLDPELEDQWPDLRRAGSLRNRIIHGYDDVNNVVIWDSVQAKLPILMRTIDTLLVACDEEALEQNHRQVTIRQCERRATMPLMRFLPQHRRFCERCQDAATNALEAAAVPAIEGASQLGIVVATPHVNSTSILAGMR